MALPDPALLLEQAIADHQAGRIDAARRGYEALLRRNPRDPNALNLLGVVLVTQGQPGKGIQLLRRAVAAYPAFPAALSNLGKALLDSGQPGPALESCDQALRFAPGDPEIHNNRGNALLALGRVPEALSAYRAALVGRPDYPEALTNEGVCLLALGDLAAGWRRYEARWRLPHLAPLAAGLPAARWTGAASVAGKRLLLWAEQGLGDTLQFCRYAPLLAQAGADVVLEVQPSLRRLCETLEGVGTVIAQGAPRPTVDLQCPLLSLPLAAAALAPEIPAAIPYLRADPTAVAAWRARLAPHPRPHVGLVWAGNPRRDHPEGASIDQRRSLPLSALAGIGGATFVSLQKGERAREARRPPAGMALLDWTDHLNDFADTAALVAALDLVIGVDTSVIHLAGALGRPTWVLNRFDRCWRWLRDRTDTPWYPTMRLFTQPRPGEWGPVVRAVRDALAEHGGAG